MKCSYPNLCIWYDEIDISNNLKKSVCILKDIEINYHNLNQIEDCQDHKTLQEIREKWKSLAI